MALLDVDRADEDALAGAIEHAARHVESLERLRALTKEASVFSNRALLVNNASLAGRLAAALPRD